MMKRASLFVLVALVLCFAVSAPQAAPRLVMPETTFDFGFVSIGCIRRATIPSRS
jgi:hypothetical protein